MKQRLEINKGVFKLLFNNCGFTIASIRQILKDYAKEKLELKKPKSKTNPFYMKVSVLIQQDFNAFMEWLRKNGKHYPKYERDYYEVEDFGDFAYNGSADDL
jgi:hypothetical protein